MAQGMRELSLKNPDGTWGGLRDTSIILPRISGATFSELTNCYVNRDGTELRRFLGSQVAGRPFLGMLRQVYQVERNQPTPGNTRVTVAHQWDQQDADNRYPHYAPTTFNVKFADSSVIPDGIYTATRIDKFQFSIPIVASADETAQNGTGRVFIQRIHSVQALISAGGRAVVIAETASVYPNNTGDIRGIASWVASRVLDPTNVLDVGYPRNTQGGELAVDNGFISWPAATVEPHYRDWKTVENKTPGENDLPQTVDFLRRIVADVLNRRVLIAAAGHACMFQVDVAREDIPLQLAEEGTGNTSGGTQEGERSSWVANHRFTKALGIPRGVLHSANFTSGSEQCMFLAAGYRDPISGEVGLPSVVEEIFLDSVSSVTVTVYTPRNALTETYGLDIVLYVSEAAPQAEAVLFPFSQQQLREDEQVQLDITGADLEVRPLQQLPAVVLGPSLNVENQVDPRRFPILEQMPRGAAWVRVVRARMFAGGDAPRNVSGGIGLRAGMQQVSVEGVLRNAVEFGTINTPSWSFIGMRADGFVLPSGYEGSRLSLYDYVNTADGFGRMVIGMLGRRLNDPDWPTSTSKANTILFEYDSGRNPVTFPTNEVQGNLQTQPELVQVSEEDVPGVVPATNSLPVDTLDGRTTTGMARIGDEGLIFTDRSTHIFQWGLLPRRATSRVISTQYGCIAPASAVEGPGFVAWLSHEGPMIYRGGGLRWLGAQIVDLWRSFLVESDGLMTNAQGIHDRDRTLIIWQLTTQYDSNVSDAEKSKTTNNTLLIFNYATETFTVSRRGLHAQTAAVGMLPIAKQNESSFQWSPAFVARPDGDPDYPIYTMSEELLDRTGTPIQFVATADRAPGSNTFVIGSQPVGPGQLDDAFIYGPDDTLRWFGTVAGTSAQGIDLNNFFTEAPFTTEGAFWKAGDTLENQVIHMKAQTNVLRAGELSKEINIRGVNLRLELFNEDEAQYKVRAWARVLITNEDGKVINMGRSPWGDKIESGVNRYKSGYLKANNFVVRVDLVANVQIRLQDIALEVEPQA